MFDRSAAKQFAYRSGVLSGYHRWRNRSHTTVVMFHRVLPHRDPAWEETEPAWTMPERAFAECLRFFAKHYNVISIRDLLEANSGNRELPDRTLIITFDDGWSDNVEFALPHLRSQGLPATVFVVADAVGEEEFWRETIIRAWRRGRLKDSDLHYLWKASAADDPVAAPDSWEDAKAVWNLIARLDRLESEQRLRLLDVLRPHLGKPLRRQMLSEAELKKLYAAGVTIGSHGLTHTPIPYSQNRETELADSRALLGRKLGCHSADSITSFSFPHGLYNHESVSGAKNAGYELIFTSDKNLNLTRRGRTPLLLGRINMDSGALTDESGGLRPELLALWLFERPARFLEDA